MKCQHKKLCWNQFLMAFSFLILILTQRKHWKKCITAQHSIWFVFIACFIYYSSHLFSVWTIFHSAVFLFFYNLKKFLANISNECLPLLFFCSQFKACSFILCDDDKMLKIVWIALKWHEVGEQDVAGCSCCCLFFSFISSALEHYRF